MHLLVNIISDNPKSWNKIRYLKMLRYALFTKDNLKYAVGNSYRILLVSYMLAYIKE